MKNLFLACLMLVGVSAGFVGCQKRDVATTPKTSNSVSVNGGANAGNTLIRPYGDAEYCRGCGTSSDKNFGCNWGSCEDRGIHPEPSCGDAIAAKLTTTPDGWKEHAARCYKVRDSFLAVTEKGQWYITYYYELSRLAKDLIDASNCLDYLSFAEDILVVANEVQFGPSASKPVTTKFQDKAQSFIDNFKAHTSDATLLEYLSRIESDLAQFSGKENSYIRAEIGL